MPVARDVFLIQVYLMTWAKGVRVSRVGTCILLIVSFYDRLGEVYHSHSINNTNDPVWGLTMPAYMHTYIRTTPAWSVTWVYALCTPTLRLSPHSFFHRSSAAHPFISSLRYPFDSLQPPDPTVVLAGGYSNRGYMLGARGGVVVIPTESTGERGTTPPGVLVRFESLYVVIYSPRFLIDSQ